MATHSRVLPGESQGWGNLWAAIYGLTQSRTWLKRLSSSSSRSSLCGDAVNHEMVPSSGHLEGLHNNVKFSQKNLTCDQWILGHFVVVQSLYRVRLFATPWTAACQALLSLTTSCSLLRFMSIEWVMSSNHPILCRPLLLLPSIFPSVRVFSNESALCIRGPSGHIDPNPKVVPYSSINKIDILTLGSTTFA